MKFAAFIIVVFALLLSTSTVLAAVDAHGVTMGATYSFGNVLVGASITLRNNRTIYNVTVSANTDAPNISIFQDTGGGSASFLMSTNNRTGDTFYFVQDLPIDNYFFVVTNGTGYFNGDMGPGSFPITTVNVVWNGRASPVTYPGASGWAVFSDMISIVSIGSENSSASPPCSPNWVCGRYADCAAGTLVCLNATDLNVCGDSFNGTLSMYDLTCNDANRTSIFYDTFTGADNWIYYNGIAHSIVDGILSLQDATTDSRAAYVAVTTGNETIHSETLLRYSQNTGDYGGFESSNFPPHSNNFEVFLMNDREIVCQNESALVNSGYYLSLDTWHVVDVEYAPSSGFWNLSIDSTLICINMGNTTDTPMQEFVIGGGSSLATFTAEYDYVNISYDNNAPPPCIPAWSCSSFGTCVNLTAACLNVTDSHVCGVPFAGNLSSYNVPCVPVPVTVAKINYAINILLVDLVLFVLVSMADGLMKRKSPLTEKAFRNIYGFLLVIAIIAILALLI